MVMVTTGLQEASLHSLPARPRLHGFRVKGGQEVPRGQRRSAVSRAGLHIHFEALTVVHGVPVHGGVRVVIASLLLCFDCSLFARGVPHRIADSHEPRQDLSQDEQS